MSTDPCKYGFVVLWTPWKGTPGAATVDEMKVIDAWASSDRSLSAARRTLTAEKLREYYAKHGDGLVMVALCGGSRLFTLSPEETR